MQINEIFSSIDGEGIRTGYPVTFIRTQFCSLKCNYCFGPNKAGRYPRVTMLDGTKKPLNEVAVGDILLTLNDNKEIVETTVTAISKRMSDEYHNIITPDSILCCTPEHPFWVDNNWKNASDLKPGDYLYKVKDYEYSLYHVYGSNYKNQLINYSKTILELYDNMPKHGNSGENNGNYSADAKNRNYNKFCFYFYESYYST